MRVLVTGAGGQIGRALLAAAPPGVTVVPATRADLDITSAESIACAMRHHRPDLVFNAAGYTNVNGAEHDRRKALSVNAEAVGATAAAVEEAGARFVHLSTDYVFDGSLDRPYRPHDAPKPINAYGDSKWRGEQAALAASPNCLILRTAWVYGPTGRNFMTEILKQCRGQSRIEVVRDQFGTPTSVRGLAATLWKLALKKSSGVFHYTDSGVTNRYEFANAIQETALAIGILSRSVPIVPIVTKNDGTHVRRPLRNVLDKSKTWATLGETAPSWRDNLLAVLRDMHAHV